MKGKNIQKKNENNIFIRKRILQIIIVIFSLTLLLITLITLASTVRASNLAIGRYRFYIMRTDSQPEIAQSGDLVIAHKTNPGEIKVGDSVVYGDNDVYYCDKIIEVNKSNTVNKVILAEKDGVKYQFNESDISGKVVKRFYKLGNIIAFLKTPVGIVFFMLFLICLFALLKILVNYYDNDEINDKVKTNDEIEK